MLNILPAYFEQLKRAFHSENEHRVRLLCTALSAAVHTECGVFGADMQVSMEGDGPVTIVMDSRHLKRER